MQKYTCVCGLGGVGGGGNVCWASPLEDTKTSSSWKVCGGKKTKSIKHLRD